MTWTPAAQVFPSTLAAMGGWPWARLVLFGADAGLAASLSELGVTSAVPLAADEPEALQLVERRPPTVSDDQNYKAVVQGHTRHLYEKSGLVRQRLL